MTAGTLQLRVPQGALVIAAAGAPTNKPRITQGALVIASGPPQSRAVRAAQGALVIAAAGAPTNKPRITQGAIVIACLAGLPQQEQSLAWTFMFDGHPFYVLNLGSVGTYVFDQLTNRWSNFSTQGFAPMWNMLYGVQWGSAGDRVAGFDALSPVGYEIDPSAVLDEGWRDIYHEVTAFITARGRAATRMDDLRVVGSVGDLDEIDGASFNMQFSDNNGATWSPVYSVSLEEGETWEISWRSLGSFLAPGRIISLYDSGGLVRIDGADWNTTSTPPVVAAVPPPQSGGQ